MSPAPYPTSIFPTLSPTETAALLTRVLERARQVEAAVVAFDLDSTLLDNRPRQARILREYGAANQLEALSAHHADQWQGWDARLAMAASGMTKELIDLHITPFRDYWKERFFTSEYCVDDIGMPGASAFVDKVLEVGARVFYLTGRHEAMRAGTVASFRNTSFALPDEDRVHLLMKPTLEEHDDAYKLRTYAVLREHGEVIAAFDNEPAHINGYRAAFPAADVIHLATDHSMREIALAAGIPSIRDFTLP